MKKLLLVFLILFAGTAAADPCPPTSPAPKTPKHHKVPPKAPVAPPAAPCACPLPPQGPPGPVGPQGPAGRDGETGLLQPIVIVRPAAGLALRVGIMGALEMRGDWAWGPALGLVQPLGRGEVTFDVGFAMPVEVLDWSPGRESAILFRGEYVRFGDMGSRNLGLAGGLSATMFRASASRPFDESYLSAGASLVYRHDRMRLEAGPTIGARRGGESLGTSAAVGLQGSLFVMLGGGS